MAQFVKNSTNYNGARSKTTFSARETTDNRSKKGKKKGSETGYKEANAWGKRQSQSNPWQDPIPDKRRETRTLWDNIEHEFPACDTTAAEPNVCEQKQRKFAQPNVWEQRQMKFQENKALEPRDENEEEKMIRLALELSKRETETDSMRRRLEEEYRMQEQMLKNNPDAFKEFQFQESSDAFPEEKFPSNERNAESEELDDGKYAMALKSNPTKRFTSTSNSKSYNNSDNSGDKFKRNHPSFNYKQIDNWEGYSNKVNTSHAKITSSGDNWDDIKDTIPNNISVHKTTDASNSKSYDNWGNYDDSNQSSSNYSKADCWDDYEEPQTQKNHKVSHTSSKHDSWDDIQSSETNHKDYEYNSKEKEMVDTRLKPPKQKKTYIQPVEKEMVNSNNANKNVRKVVDMFGGWGSATTTSENVSRKDVSTTVVEKSTGKSLNKLKSNGVRYESNEIETLTAAVQELQTEDDTFLLKKDSVSKKEVLHFSDKMRNHESKKIEKDLPPRVSDVDTTWQDIEDEALSNQELNTTQGMKHNSISNEAIVSDKTKQSEHILNSKIETKYESPLSNKMSLVDPVFSSDTTTSINQESSFIDANKNKSASNKNELNNLTTAISNQDMSCFESSNVSTYDTMSHTTSFASVEHSNQFPVFSPNEAPKQVPNFLQNECINPPKQVPNFHSSECINPTQQTAAFQSNEYINSPKQAAAFQSNECINSPKEAAAFQSNECIGSPKQAAVFQSNEYIQPHVHDSAFQSLNSNMNTEAPNITPSVPSTTFPPPELMNSIPSPASQMGGEFMNPNLMSGIDPLLMQYMQMISNPFLATQWQAWEMYYRTMGMPIGPMILPQVPMMTGLRNPTISDPINSPYANNHNNMNFQSHAAFEQPAINTDISPINGVLSPHEQYNVSNVTQEASPTSVFPDIPLKLDDETESLLKSFLSPKEETNNDNEIFIKPPVVAAESTSESTYTLTSAGETIPPRDNQPNISKSCNKSLSDNTEPTNVFQPSIVEPSECIGWGDPDFKTSSKLNQNTWDEEVDGWGGENSTTKSMGNPSRYNSAKSANRQPSSQPNFRRFRK